jgi:hypothetical protein
MHTECKDICSGGGENPMTDKPGASGQPVPADEAAKKRDAEFYASQMRHVEAFWRREKAWSKRQRGDDIARAIDGRIVEPIGAGVVPLSNAGLWIAYQGGAIDLTERSEAKLTAAFEDLIKQLIDDGAVLTGRNPESRDEPFPASNLQGLDLHYTDTVLAFPMDLLSADELTTLSETDEARWHEAEERRQFWERQDRLQPGGEFGFVEFAFCPDGYFWNRQVNDKLFRAGQHAPLWTNIQVSREFVRTHWPFHLHGNHSAAVQLDAYGDIAKHYEDEGRRRSGLDRRAKQVERIKQPLAAPALRDRTHCRVSEIIDRCVLDNDAAKRAVYFRAFELAVIDGIFNEGKRQQSQLFFLDVVAPFFMRLTKDRFDKCIGDENEIATVARRGGMDPAEYRARKLERLAERTWMPRRFIARWLTGYGLPVPSWLEDTALVAPSAALPNTSRMHSDDGAIKKTDTTKKSVSLETCSNYHWCDVVERVRRVMWGEACIEKLTRGEQELTDKFGVGCHILSSSMIPGRYTSSEALSSPPALAEALTKARDKYKAMQYQRESALEWLERSGLSPRQRGEALIQWHERTLPDLEKRLRWEFGVQETPGKPSASAVIDPKIEVHPCWRIKDGERLTQGEKQVLEVVQGCWPNGYGSERHIISKIKKALPSGNTVGDTTIKRARAKIEFA